MTRYSELYRKEHESHAMTKRKLRQAEKQLGEVSAFIRGRYEVEFVEWILEQKRRSPAIPSQNVPGNENGRGMRAVFAGAIMTHDNLTIDYPPDFLASWDGCNHLDCLPQCRVGLESGYCERIERAFADFRTSVTLQKPTKPEGHPGVRGTSDAQRPATAFSRPSRTGEA